MPVGRISHWHLLCSKNTGESHLESSQCLRITLGIFSKFLRIVITHAEKASIVCDDLFQILLQERHGRLALLRVSLNAEETVTVFPALFFYPKAGGRRLKH